MNNEVLNADEQLAAEQEAMEFKAAFSGETVETDPEPSGESGKAKEDPPSPRPLTADDLERARLEAAAEAKQQYEKRIRDLSGEVGGLRQKLESLETAKAAAERQGAEAPTARQIKDASQSGEKLAALKADFPEFAEALEEALAAVKPVNLDEINQRLSAAEEARQKAESTAEELQTLAQLRQLDKAHPGWESDVNSDAYTQWLATQPANIQYAANESKDARDAIAILNMFKKSDVYLKATTSTETLTATGRQKSQRLESAITPTSGGQAHRKQPKTEHEEFLEAFGRR
jgi:hypothetical protein